MITLQEFCQQLNALLKPELFSDLCPNGLQVEGKQEIKQVATAVSASLETIQLAVKAGVDALVVHHGIFWQGDSPVVQGVRKQKLQLLLDHGISLLGYHIPLDANPEVGNNYKAARDLNWNALEPFGNFKGSLIGVKGTVAHIPVEQFKQQLEHYYEHVAYHTPAGKPTITKAALLSGGAHWSIKEAIAQGIDAFITGSFDEPIWNLAMEEGIHFFALGHAATERIGPKALKDYVSSTLNLPTIFLDTHNPF